MFRSILKRVEGLFLPKINDWVISDDLSWMEFEYSAIDWINVDTIPDIKNAKVLWFNQWSYKQTTTACTIVNSTRALLATANWVWWYNATIKDIFDAVTLAITDMAYIVWKWWFAFKWVDAARKWWNTTHPDMLINSLLIQHNDPDYEKIVKRIN